MKNRYVYGVYNFKLSQINEMQDFMNGKGEIGFKVINTHYYTLSDEDYVRIIMERELSLEH